MCDLRYSIPKEILTIFDNRSNYHYHFIIKELPEEAEGQFTCLGVNSEKHISFSVPIEKEHTRSYKEGKEIAKASSYILQFTDSTKCIASSLSNLVNTLTEWIHKIKVWTR